MRKILLGLLLCIGSLSFGFKDNSCPRCEDSLNCTVDEKFEQLVWRWIQHDLDQCTKHTDSIIKFLKSHPNFIPPQNLHRYLLNRSGGICRMNLVSKLVKQRIEQK